MTAASPNGVLRRIPIVASIVVGVAVAVMIGLGVWQLGRADEKQALLARYTANQGLETMLPTRGPVPDAILFRTTQAVCVRVVRWRQLGGSAADGSSGFRFLAECGSGAEGPGFVADMGVAEDPHTRPRWQGGVVRGILTTEPVNDGLWARFMGTVPVARPMVVAATPAAGLKATMPPNPSNVPNNHMSYAVQWFLFAAAALVIYLLALRKRMKPGA